jgi:uncharacterized protein (UPF0335 family)
VNGKIAELNADRREIYAELKGAGYDLATVRTIIKRREMDADKRQTMDELLELYAAALGDFAGTPLGMAGARELAAMGAEVSVKLAGL